jgi:dihydrofolate reductase
MRKLIAGMQTSLDGKIEGPEGYADWVDEWSDHYDVLPRVDAALLGGGMYPGYEQYWSAIQERPDEPPPMTEKVPTPGEVEEYARLPTPGEVEYARFTAQAPHYVLSSTLTSATWANTSFLRGLDEVGSLKQQPGKDIYLVGGARVLASLIDAGLVDELRLTVHPLIAGEGKSLFATAQGRRGLELQEVQQSQDGLVNLVYGIGEE